MARMRWSPAWCFPGAALLGVLAGCGGGAGDAEQFCGDVSANVEAMLTPPDSAGEIDDFVGLYRRLGETAPLAIDEEWAALVLNYETASTVEPGDPESVQRVVTHALRTEEAALRVREWLLANCEVDLGDVATIAAAAPAPAPPTATTTDPDEEDD